MKKNHNKSSDRSHQSSSTKQNNGRDHSQHHKTNTNSYKNGGPVLKQPTFDLKSPDKDLELYNFEIKVTYIFLSNNYNIQECGKVHTIITW